MDRIFLIFALLGTVICTPGGGCLQDDLPSPIQTFSPQKLTRISAFQWLNLDPNNRTLCPETPGNRPSNRVNTTERLTSLRLEMNTSNLDAYLVELRDEHGSGGAAYDRRLQYITGYSGSSGYALVTKDKAALWTDGRYFLQADQQMDCNWILMEQGTRGYPTSTEWLLSVLENEDKVGADPKLVSISGWQSYQKSVSVKNISMVEVNDLIDTIWISDRPTRPNNDLFIHTYEYTGEHLADKINRTRLKMAMAEADALVLTALDDTAWTFNLRGTDRPTNPLFYSYAIILQNEVRLFLTNFTRLISPEAIHKHLNTNPDGTCSDISGTCVEVKEYDTFITALESLKNNNEITKIWLGPGSNYATLSAIMGKDYLVETPTQLMKSIKNDVERRRFKECIVRDSAALVEFIAFLEAEVQGGSYWDEFTAANKVDEIRSTYPVFHSISFGSISAFGPNAAIIHYRPTEDDAIQITDQGLYLLDSGGQYLDGTTDVTRTFHFGTPTDEEKEAYTRVLMAVIELALTVWPYGLKGTQIDIRARNPLYENGWDYNHGTGHGIGYFLNVHEGPGSIRVGWSDDHAPLTEGMFFSDEPGFYMDGKFGVRLEILITVEKADTPNNFDDADYLTFEEATLVPFEPHLIKYELLDRRHIRWLNQYNKRCMEETYKYLEQIEGEHEQALAWLRARTEEIPEDGDPSIASFTTVNHTVALLVAVACYVFLN